ncbi:MAG: hypothetical protein IT377_26105 [Polyangiaceae bacterium]|nr:hypothetical protein [Polyangiaceae bacterium]
MSRARFALAFALLLTAGAAHAGGSAIDPKAKAHLDRGLELYAQKDYAGAIAELEKGYAIDPKPELMYARAQAERLGGKCTEAVGHYEAFLATGPEPEREAAARANLAKCKDELAAKAPAPAPAPTPTPTPAPVAAAPQSAPPGPAPKRPAPPVEASPWYSDVLGDVLLGSGLVATGVGGFFLLSSYGNESTAEDAGAAPGNDNYAEHQARLERAERQRTTGVIVGAGGLALICGAVLRYTLREPAGPRVGLSLGPAHAGVSFGRAF